MKTIKCLLAVFLLICLVSENQAMVLSGNDGITMNENYKTSITINGVTFCADRIEITDNPVIRQDDTKISGSKEILISQEKIAACEYMVELGNACFRRSDVDMNLFCEDGILGLKGTGFKVFGLRKLLVKEKTKTFRAIQCIMQADPFGAMKTK